ncbi:hypothetical protein DIE18_04190 [Burkholderia sp. Bp9125]|nr:hypothetical protein DIE18_04190 [Burkholderia sp. Bp9125]
MATNPSVTPVVGPTAPLISFWYGDHYLGVTRGHPSDVEAARSKLLRVVREQLLRAVREQVPVHALEREVFQLSRAGAQLSCGMVRKDLSYSR